MTDYSEGGRRHLINLSAIDFETLAKHFAGGHRRTEAEQLKAAVAVKLANLVRLNHSRVDYVEQFQKLIAEYNADSRNVEAFFADLVDLAQRLRDEEKRAIAENLTEEELAVFDLLTRPEVELTAAEELQVKTAARDLLETLKREKLVLDWRKRQQSRASVLVAINKVLDEQLPKVYSAVLYRQKCEAIYQHVYDSYFGPGRSVYGLAS